jgi:SET domain-containing protein
VTRVGIQKDQYVTEYCGEIISQQTCINRMSTDYKDMHHYYFLDYDNGEVIDGCQKGSVARFINHSCDPNCRIEKWTVGAEFRIAVIAERYIEPGEELTYDYKFESFGIAQSCLCGSKNCRGVFLFFVLPFHITKNSVFLKHHDQNRYYWS